ncbi:flippase-like domain-containing protein [bacterium]|nr:flippase-like domain-containing protein [bacterium]
MRAVLKSTLFQRGIIIFVALSTMIILGILVFTTEKETWRSIADFKLIYIPVLVFLAILRWFFDGEAFVVLSKYGSRRKLSLKRATVIRLEGFLVSSIIPILVGTLSTHTYLLHKEKIRISESVAIAVLISVLPVFLFLLNVPILIFIRDGSFHHHFFNQLLRTISVPIIAAILLFIVILFYPGILKRITRFFIKAAVILRLVHRDRMSSVSERLFSEVDKFSKILWFYIVKRKLAIVSAGFWILAAFTVDYLIALVIMSGFGFTYPVIKSIALQFLMRPIIYFAPSPGGAGIWEFTYLGFFSIYMPRYLIGIAVLLWRLLVSYIPMIAGLVLFIREFGNDKKISDLFKKGSSLRMDLEDPEILDEEYKN